MKDHWLQFSPRVGFAWDPTGDGRMSIRAGYSLAYDFVNAQFHLNTSVAPPFNAEARTPTNPVGGFDDPWRGTGNETFFPFTTGPNSPFPLTGPYISMAPGPRRRRGSSRGTSASSVRSATTWPRLGDVSGHLLRSAVERAALNSLRLHSGFVHAADANGPAVLPDPCSTPATLDFRRVLTMQNYAQGRYLGVVDEHMAIGDQKYNGLVLSVNRRSANGVTAGANYTLSKCTGLPTQGGTTPNVNSGYVESRPSRLRPRPLRFGPPAQLQPDRQRADAAVRQQGCSLAGVGLAPVGHLPRLLGLALLGDGQRRPGAHGHRRPARQPVGRPLRRRLDQQLPEPGVLHHSGRLAPTAMRAATHSTARASSSSISSLVRSFRFANTHRLEARIESFNAFNWFQQNNPQNQPRQRAVRPDHVGGRPAHHAVRVEVSVLRGSRLRAPGSGPAKERAGDCGSGRRPRLVRAEGPCGTTNYQPPTPTYNPASARSRHSPRSLRSRRANWRRRHGRGVPRH